jgi:hypothetical protein
VRLPIKSSIIIIFALVLFLPLGWRLLPHSPFRVQLQTATNANTPCISLANQGATTSTLPVQLTTVPAIADTPGSSLSTQVLTTLTLPSQLTMISEVGGTLVSYAGISFTISPDMASGVEAGMVPQANEGMNVWPVYVKFVLQGYNPESTAYQPQILIFPVADYEQLSNNPATSRYDAKTMVTNLQTILDTQQFPPQGYYLPIESMNNGNYLPVLPDQHASEVFHAQEAILKFQNGTGIRFITSFSQAHYPAIGPDMLYTFQGLTSDGKYYVSVFLPIQQPQLLSTPAPENDVDYLAYMAAAIEKLNQPEGEGVNPFAPSLALLDTLVQSIIVLDSAASAP